MRPLVSLRAIGMCRVGSRRVAATERQAVERQASRCARVWPFPAARVAIPGRDCRAIRGECAMSCVLKQNGDRNLLTGGDSLMTMAGHSLSGPGCCPPARDPAHVAGGIWICAVKAI
jgi:hypothetical protein